MSKITVIGAGYVGLVTAACMAKLGHQVTCVEADKEKAAAIKRNQLPIQELNLKPLWQHYQRQRTLRITPTYDEAISASEFVFLCVGTPGRRNGTVDLEQVLSAIRSIVSHLGIGERPTLIIKSTVPVGTNEFIASVIAEWGMEEALSVVSNPEFLREGHAVEDFMQPARVVIGSIEQTTGSKVAELYAPLGCPIVFCDPRTAELTKYASNAFLATKISFINEIAELSESYGVDVVKVAEAIGMDPRIGADYLAAGLGWGGTCLPKDISALITMAKTQAVSYRLLSSVVQVNKRQPRLILRKLRRLLGRLDGLTVALWGLTFKPDCDDLRDSPALDLAILLKRAGCRVQAYDPQVTASIPGLPDVFPAADPYEAATSCDAIVLATAWREFQEVDFEKLRGIVRRPVILDARNTLRAEAIQQAGFIYVGMGRSSELASHLHDAVLQVADMSAMDFPRLGSELTPIRATSSPK